MSESFICKNCKTEASKVTVHNGRWCAHPDYVTCVFEKFSKVTDKVGTKHDQEKPDFSLLSSHALEDIAAVMTFGKKKYAAHNWRNGISNSRLFAAAMRHLWAWNRGEDLDPESGLSHLAHAGCCLMMLLENIKLRPKLDDRWRPSE